MAKAGPRAQGDRSAAAQGRVVEAAIEALKESGYAGASAREIARIGGFAQGVVFYHFGSMDQLLLAALDETARQRMERYEAAVAEATSVPELVEVAGRVYREDLEAGHIKVLGELIAASSNHPALGAAVADRLEPWVGFVAEVVERFTAGTPLAGLIPVRDVAFAVVALFLGVELLTHLGDDRSPAESLIATATGVASMLAPLLGSTPGPPTEGMATTP